MTKTRFATIAGARVHGACATAPKPNLSRIEHIVVISKAILPPQTQRAAGGTLSEKGVTWAWYAVAWNVAPKDGMQAHDAPREAINTREAGAPYFVTHHQPFNDFANCAGTAARAAHFKDYDDLVADIDKGTLPAVAFYKPQGTLNQHPAYADVASGDQHIADLLAGIEASPLWSSTVIIVTYDENGGFWDHVPPPKGDRGGPGTRIPALIVSPYAKKGYVDHTSYDTTSIIEFIALRFGLTALSGVRAGVGDLANALDVR